MLNDAIMFEKYLRANDGHRPLLGDREGEITGSGIENKILTFYQSLLGNHFNGRKKFLFLMKYLSASVVEGWISQLRTIAREKEQSTYLPNNTF